jgi:multidrug efflux pump subunit AcrA (membrane-fusion protein)
MDLDIKITKDGEIHAIENIDIPCKVEGSNAITYLVKEGASVKKGDTLLMLDSTDMRQKLEDTALLLEKAEADLSNAKEMLEIQKSSNATGLEGAQVAQTLAELDLKQYTDGTYPQQVANAKTDVEMAEITLRNRQEDLDETKRLYAKNFVTAADVEKGKLDVTTASQALDKARTSLEILTKYSHEMDLTSRINTLAQAKQRVVRTERENASNLAWREADLNSKELSLALLKRRHERLKEQFAACTVTAPADGMVIYGSTTDRSSPSQIQEGAMVRERQLLVRLPDTSAMKAVVRIHESLVGRLREGQRATVRIVGIKDPVGARLAKIAVVADSSNRSWNPDLREYPVDLYLDKTPANLKPGIGAVVEIEVDHLPDVLAVPLDAVYSAGDSRYIFIPDGDRVTPRKVQVGATNDTHVEITEGLAAGTQVLRLQAGQGRELLEKAGISVEPASRPSRGKGSRSRAPK